jgi:hypothetical protein
MNPILLKPKTHFYYECSIIMTRWTFESFELINVIGHEFIGSFCELESLDLDVPQLQLLVLDFLEILKDEHA